MSMLAGPRKKQRLSAFSRGNQWYSDVNKFGQKMLEKMGWSPGKGLGRNEDGIKEYIKQSKKDDLGGVGYKENSEQWTEHEVGFTSLLATLNGGNSSAEIKKPEKSLEQISQSSRARVHYKKFTRGKDLSLRSEKDLANIFGRTSLEKPVPKPEEEEKETPASRNMADYFATRFKENGKRFCFINSPDPDSENLPEVDNEEEEDDEPSRNMADYFAAKFKKCGKTFTLTNGDSSSSDIVTETYRRKLDLQKENLDLSSTNNEEESSEDSTKMETEEVEPNSLSKRKRKAGDDAEASEQKPAKIKKKKKKDLAFDNLGADIDLCEEVCYDNPCLAEPEKNAQNVESEDHTFDNPAFSPTDRPPKKRVTFACPELETYEYSTGQNEPKSQKKNKKLKEGIDNLACDDFEENTTAHEYTTTKSPKKKLKILNEGNLTLQEDEKNDTVDSECTAKKLKKKDKRASKETAVWYGENNPNVDETKSENKKGDNLASEENSNESAECSTTNKSRKKNKKAKHVLNDTSLEGSINLEEIYTEENDEGIPRRKTKSPKSESNEEITVQETNECVNETPSAYKKKNKKRKFEMEEDSVSVDQNCTLEENTPKIRKKKRKNAETGFDNLACEINTVEESVASINDAIDNYQNELENEMNERIDEVKSQKSGKKKKKTT